MLSSVLPFDEDVAARVSDYCEEHSSPIPKNLLDHWEHTRTHFSDADKMSSKLQGSWMIFTAKDRKPKRVLEIGCYSGYSAVAWYEGTKDTDAEIVTLELNKKMIAASKAAFDRLGVHDRIRLVEGPAQESLERLEGDFDLIFVDANKDGYASYVRTVLSRKLLSPNGIILCDNVFARGLSIGKDCAPWLNDHVRKYWQDCGDALNDFNNQIANDPRVDVFIMPVFDGVTQIKWKGSTTQDMPN